MSKASADEGGTRRSIVPFVAYAIVLATIGWAALNLWSWRTSGTAQRERAASAAAISPAKPIEAVHTSMRNNLSANSPEPLDRPSTKQEIVAERAASPPAAQTAAAAATAAQDPPAAKEPEPPKSRCPIDVGQWPTDRTDQGKAIQVLLQVLGYYSGTTYGTVGPTTRAAIRKFQVAMGEAETGEPSQMLFELLKKKCDSPTP